MKDKETESELSKDGTETSNIGTESDSESGFNSLNGACTSKPFILFLFTKKKKEKRKEKMQIQVQMYVPIHIALLWS